MVCTGPKRLGPITPKILNSEAEAGVGGRRNFENCECVVGLLTVLVRIGLKPIGTKIAKLS